MGPGDRRRRHLPCRPRGRGQARPAAADRRRPLLAQPRARLDRGRPRGRAGPGLLPGRRRDPRARPAGLGGRVLRRRLQVPRARRPDRGCDRAVGLPDADALRRHGQPGIPAPRPAHVRRAPRPCDGRLARLSDLSRGARAADVGGGVPARGRRAAAARALPDAVLRQRAAVARDDRGGPRPGPARHRRLGPDAERRPERGAASGLRLSRRFRQRRRDGGVLDRALRLRAPPPGGLPPEPSVRGRDRGRRRGDGRRGPAPARPLGDRSHGRDRGVRRRPARPSGIDSGRVRQIRHELRSDP